MGVVNHLLGACKPLEDALIVATTVPGNLECCLGCKGSNWCSFGVDILGAEFFFFSPILPPSVLVNERTGDKTETEIDVVSLGDVFGGASVLGRGEVLELVAEDEEGITTDEGGGSVNATEEFVSVVAFGVWLMKDLAGRGAEGRVALLHTEA